MHRCLSALLCGCLWQFGLDAHALDRAACDREAAVRIGSEGKDVIWVPTHDKLVTAMLQAADTTSRDYVIDLGAGDGRIAIAAAKEFGARALGIEYDAKMVRLARCYVEAEGLTGSVEIRQADIFESDLNGATVLTLYLLQSLNRKLRPTILTLAPGTRVVSNRFDMGRWQPDRTITVEGVSNHAYLWIVPARIAGRWHLERDDGAERFTLRIEQEFQRVRAYVANRSSVRVESANLQGSHLELILKEREGTFTLRGPVSPDRVELSAERDGMVVKYLGSRR